MAGPTAALPSDEAGSFDVVVVGGGIVGLSVACELVRLEPSLAVSVLEAGTEVGGRQTSHNSGVIHAGVYYAPGSLKARLCVEGARRMREFCIDRGLPFRQTGKLIIACSHREVGRLEELRRRATANGISVERLDRRGIEEVEPRAGGIAALHVRDTAIADFRSVARELAGDLAAAGVPVALGTKVEGIERRAGLATVHHADGEVRARLAIACTGSQSDRLARTGGGSAEPRIVPFRGAYLRLRPEVARGLGSLIYPVPDPTLPFLGVHVTPTVGGEVLLGPTSQLWHSRDGGTEPRDIWDSLSWPGTWRLLRNHRKAARKEARLFLSRRAFVAECARLLPGLEVSDVEPGPAGIRAQAVARDGALVEDFVFDSLPGVTHVRNAPSPAATSAWAIGTHLAESAISRLHQTS